MCCPPKSLSFCILAVFYSLQLLCICHSIELLHISVLLCIRPVLREMLSAGDTKINLSGDCCVQSSQAKSGGQILDKNLVDWKCSNRYRYVIKQPSFLPLLWLLKMIFNTIFLKGYTEKNFSTF